MAKMSASPSPTDNPTMSRFLRLSSFLEVDVLASDNTTFIINDCYYVFSILILGMVMGTRLSSEGASGTL